MGRVSVAAFLPCTPHILSRQSLFPAARNLHQHAFRKRQRTYNPPVAVALPPKPKSPSFPNLSDLDLPAHPKQPETPQNESAESLLSYLAPRALLLFVAAIWGTNFGTVKLLQSSHLLTISEAALARFTFSALAMMPLIGSDLPSGTRFPKGYLANTFLIGLSIFGGYMTQSFSLVGTEANKSAFICSLAVIIVPIINHFSHALGLGKGRQINRGWLSTYVAPLLAVAGVGMLELGSMTPPSTADMWALAQAVCFAFGFVLNERAAERYPNLITSTTALQLVAVSVLTGVWATLDVSFAAGVPSLPHISAAFTAPSAAVAVLYAGIVTTALTVWLENIALARVSAQEMAVLLSTEPLWAAGFASILLGEHMGGQAVCGGMVILVACVMNQMRGDVGGKVGSKLRGWGKKAGVGSLLMSLQVLGIWK